MFEYIKRLITAPKEWKERQKRLEIVDLLKKSGDYQNLPPHELDAKLGITEISKDFPKYVLCSDYYSVESPAEFRKAKRALNKYINKQICALENTT